MKILLLIGRKVKSLGLLAKAMIFTMLMSMTAMAIAGHHGHRMHDLLDDLDLTDQQEDQIEAIRDNYKDQYKQNYKEKRKELRDSDASKADKKAKRAEFKEGFKESRQAMMTEMLAVLNDEQKATLVEKRKEKIDKMSKKMQKRLGKKLDLNDSQKDQVADLFAKQVTAHKNALSVDSLFDREKMKSDFEGHRKELSELFSNILEDEQKEDWAKMEKRMDKFSKHHGKKGRHHKWGGCDDEDES